MRRHRRTWLIAKAPYYPSEQRGHQCLILDDRTVIGLPARQR